MPNWLQCIDKQFELQKATIETPFEEIINAYFESLQREEATADERDVLEEQLARLQNTCNQMVAELEGLRSEEGVDLRRFHELETKYKQIKQERLELLRIQGQNTQRLLELNSSLKEQNALCTRLEGQLNETQGQREGEHRKIAELQSLVAERDIHIQVLQDELQALQLELLHTDEKIKSLQQENEQLVQRWLTKVHENVSLLESELQSSGTRLGEPLKMTMSVDLKRQVYSVTGELGDDLVFLTTETGPLLAHGLESTIGLAAHPGGIHPHRGIFSRDRDYVVGWGAREAAESALIWTLASGKITMQLNAGLGKPIMDISALSTSNSVLLSVHQQNDAGLMRFYDIPREFCLWTEQLDSIARRVITMDGNTAVILTDDGRLQLWDIQKRRLIRKTPRSQFSLSDIAVEDGSIIGLTDRSLMVIDLNTLKVVETVQLPGPATALAVARGCFYVSIKERLAVGKISSGSLLGTCKYHQYPIVGITIVDEDLVVTADNRGTCATWKFV